jgi:DNA-directed RNA polymerase specialized sigma24 family protein
MAEWDDREEFEQLYARIKSVARAVTWCDEVEDAAQGVALRCLERGLREPIAFITLKRMVIDELRVLASQRDCPMAEDQDQDVPDRAPATSHESTGHRVERLMAQAALSDPESRAVWASFYMEWPVARVADYLGMSVPGARVVLQDALAKLRKAAEEDPDGDRED